MRCDSVSYMSYGCRIFRCEKLHLVGVDISRDTESQSMISHLHSLFSPITAIPVTTPS